MAKKRQKTGALPGVPTPQVIPELTKAGEDYEAARDSRMELTKQEVEKKTALVQLMIKHNLEVYRDASTDPVMEITLNRLSKIKCKRLRDKEEE